MTRITTQERITEMREQMTFIEERIDRLTERAVEKGKLLERKRIVDQALAEYQVAFNNNPAVAEFLRGFIGFVMDEPK